MIPLPPRRRSPLALLAAGALAGCSAASSQPARPLDGPAPSTELPGAAYLSPARWSYHPAAPEAAVAWTRLGDGGCLVLAQGGQRWVVTPDKALPAHVFVPPITACIGRGRASSAPAPEELTAIVHRSTTSWMFVGVSGTIYEATTPLGPFVRTLSPPEPLVRVAGSGTSVLGVSRNGGVLRWQDDAGWKPTELARNAGAQAPGAPLNPRAFDVVMADGGRALALALPESLFASVDGGATWVRSPLPAMGLSKIGALDTGGELLAEGLLASTSWDPQRTPAFARVATTLPSLEVELDIGVTRTPTAAAVQFGRAAMTGDRYYEVLRPDDAGELWLLAAGPIDGPLATRPIAGTSECGSMKLGANGKSVVAVCVQPQGDAVVALVLRSDNGGGAWSQVTRIEVPDVDRVGIAVALEGAALLTGVCKASDGAAECKPTAPLLLRMERDVAAVTLAAAPTLSAAASLPAFSFDGRSAYFVGYRGKDRRLALFVSHDGGETFAPRSLDRGGAAVPSAADSSASEDDEPDGEARDSSAQSGGFELEESTLHPGEDGAVGLVLAADGAPAYVTVDDDGRMLTVASAPSDGAVLAGFGRRVLAVAATARPGDQDAAQLWESLDGGVSWAELPELPALSRDFAQGSTGVTCGASACLFGETLTRVGWGGQSDAGPARALETAPRGQPAVRTPIVCEMLPSSKWTQIDNVETGAIGLPGASEVMRGRSIWSVLTRAPSGAVSAVSAMLPESGAGEARLVTRALLSAAPRGARIATSVTTQMEGYAVARVRVPGALNERVGGFKPGASMRNVELAWENWMDGTSGRGALADAGPFELGDVKPLPRGARPALSRVGGGGQGGRGAAEPAVEELFDPDLLSVSLRGIFVRPHSGSAQSSLTFFFEPGGRLQRFEFPAWPTTGLGGPLEVRSDAVIVDGQPLIVGMHRQVSGGPVTEMLLAHRRPAPSGPPGSSAAAPPWEIEAVTVAPPAGRDRVELTDWTYSGATVGVATLVVDTHRPNAWAMFQPFRGDGTLGPAQPLPTPLDLGDMPRSCSPVERASTARFEAPLLVRSDVVFTGTRHPVLVTEAAGAGGLSDPIGLLTSTVILQGTPAAPCVSGWEANALGRAPIAAIIPGDLAHAWLFRPASGPRPAGSVAIEVRPMACRFDSSAKVPEAVWNEPGTTRIENER